ncbi:MAG: tetratricopeptide repeat protein [Myxococcota bacterium]
MSEEGREWMLLPLDETMARRQGVPLRVPVPKDEFEGLADVGLSGDKLTGWIRAFLDTAPVAKDGNWRRRNSEVIGQLEGFVDKQPLLEKAQRLFSENDYAGALKTLKRVTVMMPDDHGARLNYASALANQGQHDKAFKQLRQIRDTWVGDPDFHVTVAQLQVTRGNHDAAVDELLAALEAKPDHFGAMDALAKLGHLIKFYEDPRDAASLTFVRTDALLEYLEGHWGEAPRDAGYFLEQMGYHASEGRHEVAEAAAKRAIAATSDAVCPRGEEGRIDALRRLGRVEEALTAAQAYVGRAPERPAAHIEHARCLAATGDGAGAQAAIDAALGADPGDQEALALKLWPEDRGSLSAVGAALPQLQAYADAHPEVAGAWRSLARAKLVVDDPEAALAGFARAVNLAPDDDDLRSEWWAELANQTRYDAIIADSETIENLPERDWKLRWNEAEAYRGLGRMMEARAVYMQINRDETLHVDIRKRSKRAAMELGLAPTTTPGDADDGAGEGTGND